MGILVNDDIKMTLEAGREALQQGFIPVKHRMNYISEGQSD
jgi:hypothetical protein